MGLLDQAANNLGARETLNPRTSPGPGKETTILQFRAKDRDAQNLNIVLAPVIAEPTRVVAVHPCIAIVAWGTGGAATRVEVDFGRGTELQLAASFVSISGRNDARVDDGSGQPIDPAPGPQDVVAMISGAGSRSAFGRATRTFYFASVAPGTTRLAPVPAFAKEVLVSRFSATTAIDVTIFDAVLTTVDDVSGLPVTTPINPRDQQSFASGVPAPRLELYDRAGVVQVTNRGTTPIAAVQVSFELCL